MRSQNIDLSLPLFLLKRRSQAITKLIKMFSISLPKLDPQAHTTGLPIAQETLSYQLEPEPAKKNQTKNSHIDPRLPKIFKSSEHKDKRVQNARDLDSRFHTLDSRFRGPLNYSVLWVITPRTARLIFK